MRDYADGDLAQGRLAASTDSLAREIDERFFLRGDGTRVFFFQQAELARLLSESGFLVESCEVVTRTEENRKQQLTMDRRFIQARARARPSSS